MSERFVKVLGVWGGVGGLDTNPQATWHRRDHTHTVRDNVVHMSRHRRHRPHATRLTDDIVHIPHDVTYLLWPYNIAHMPHDIVSEPQERHELIGASNESQLHI